MTRKDFETRRLQGDQGELWSTLLVGWVIVAVAALGVGGAFYYRTNDLRVLIGALAGPVMVGFVLLGTMRLIRIGTRTRQPVVHVAPRGKRSESIWKSR